MTRHVLIVGGLGLLWSSVLTNCARAQVIYYPATPLCPPPVIYLPYYPPTYPLLPGKPAYPPPKVQQEPAAPQAPRPGLAKPEAAKPEPGSSPRTTEPGRNLDGPSAPEPVKPAAFDVPKPATPEKPLFDPARIPIVPPRGADPDAGSPPLIPIPNVPSKPEVIAPPSIPMAPATEKPKAGEKPTIPPLRGIPDPTLPGLTLPLPGSDPSKSSSKSSPLTVAPRPLIDLIPVAGAPLAGPGQRRRVGFFNHTDRDLRLTVEGQSISLPRRHHISAQVPATFVWRLDDGAEQKTEVPMTAPGLEVVIRR